ncbi:MAG: tripartite tricarboxylate transporter substrate binding protein [Betaproteobacteria bacterium]|nr:tripartite tricarboxylate transporter substrate binding protein [Betaproteobacteria bacterium]
MKRSMTLRSLAGLALACVPFAYLTCAPGARAQGYPAKSISMLVPFAPGGTSDIVARMIQPGMAKDLGASIVVDNRGGGGGVIATGMLARAAPDGYTIMINHQGLAFNATLRKNLPYDTLKDLAPVALAGATPNVLVVNPALGVRSVREFLELARARPGAINYGSGGVGSAGHLPVELLQLMTGVKLVHVPYKGSGPALTDLMSGQIQAMLLTIPAAMPFIAGGKLHAIATSGTRRNPALADLPTIDEAGVKGFEYAPWYGFFAPAGVPAAILDRMHAAVNRTLADPEVRQKLLQQGMEVQPHTRAEFAAQLQGDIEKWARIIEPLGINVD